MTRRSSATSFGTGRKVEFRNVTGLTESPIIIFSNRHYDVFQVWGFCDHTWSQWSAFNQRPCEVVCVRFFEGCQPNWQGYHVRQSKTGQAFKLENHIRKTWTYRSKVQVPTRE